MSTHKSPAQPAYRWKKFPAYPRVVVCGHPATSSEEEDVHLLLSILEGLDYVQAWVFPDFHTASTSVSPDVVLLGRRSLKVIEIKSWSGRLAVEDGRWVTIDDGLKRAGRSDALRQAEGHAKKLATQLQVASKGPRAYVESTVWLPRITSADLPPPIAHRVYGRVAGLQPAKKLLQERPGPRWDAAATREALERIFPEEQPLIPDVLGLPEDEAVSAYQAAGCPQPAISYTVVSRPEADHMVTGQQPGAGSRSGAEEHTVTVGVHLLTPDRLQQLLNRVADASGTMLGPTGVRLDLERSVHAVTLLGSKALVEAQRSAIRLNQDQLELGSSFLSRLDASGQTAAFAAAVRLALNPTLDWRGPWRAEDIVDAHHYSQAAAEQAQVESVLPKTLIAKLSALPMTTLVELRDARVQPCDPSVIRALADVRLSEAVQCLHDLVDAPPDWTTEASTPARPSAKQRRLAERWKQYRACRDLLPLPLRAMEPEDLSSVGEVLERVENAVAALESAQVNPDDRLQVLSEADQVNALTRWLDSHRVTSGRTPTQLPSGPQSIVNASEGPTETTVVAAERLRDWAEAPSGQRILADLQAMTEEARSTIVALVHDSADDSEPRQVVDALLFLGPEESGRLLKEGKSIPREESVVLRRELDNATKVAESPAQAKDREAAEGNLAASAWPGRSQGAGVPPPPADDRGVKPQRKRGDSASSIRPQRVRVPDLTPLSGIEAVRSALARSQLRLAPGKKSGRASTREAGDVLRQDPPAGAQVSPGSIVTVEFASGHNTVPPVLTLQVAAAQNALVAAGFVVKIHDEAIPTAIPGTVLGCQPPVGSRWALHQPVILTVAVAPQPTSVTPDALGRTRADAQATLVAAGLVPVVFYVYSDSPAGRVVSQSVGHGRSIPRGSEVRIEVSQGSLPSTPDPRTPSSVQPPGATARYRKPNQKGRATTRLSHPLLRAFGALPDVNRVLDAFGRAHLVDVSASDGARPFLVAALAQEAQVAPAAAPVVVVTATMREAEDLTASLGAFLPSARVALLPSWETLPHERLSPRGDTVGRRLAVLRRLAHPDPKDPAYGPLSVVVAPVRAVLQPLIRGLGDLVPVALRPGDKRSLSNVVDALVAAAYTRTDMVERRGEFAVRGGILDIFPPTEEHPVRIEFSGDTVEEVRWFKVADQRSLEVAERGLWAPPCRELLLTDDVRARARALADQLPGVAEMLSKLAEGIAVEGMESLAPALVDGMESVLDVLPEHSLVLLADPERVRRRAHDLVATSEEFLEASWANAAAGNQVPVDLQSLLGSASYWSLADVRALAQRLGLAWWTLTPFAADADLVIEDDDVDERIAVRTVDAEAFRSDTERAVEHLRARVRAGWAVAVVTEGPGLAKRVAEVLREQEVAVRPLDTSRDDSLEPGWVHVACAPLGRGFVHEGGRIEVLTETDLTGQPGTASTKDMRRMPSRRRNQVDPLQLRPGDHVVHEQHGVGRFVEMMQRTVAGATREFFVMEYAPSKRGWPGDRLFVPTDQLDQVTKYVGGEEPMLNKMGGSDWTKTKSRAKRYVKQIAADLIRLYSARQATKGHAFGPDTPWQRELEDAFAYVETPDQLVSIDEVKADMEKQVPMDRLICGDVGYGKTEIAVRAAFKAIQDGKQVAVLVPTTLLVSQHQQTFADRYALFPVKVASLSRFQSDKEAKEVMTGIAEGSIDLVIGTHRLLAKDAKFKDLGLVIIDEEQRFGVEHKELLKTMRTAVDVLSMSATPIPRTLEMAVTGIREMSTLATPPEERHPVLTFVGAYDEKQITAAVRRELLREGQVFFVHNKVSSIEKAAARLRELVPEARIATAHGQMGEHKLEQVVEDFWEKRFDVLVCTTIVETGLDISNANTLIVERSDVLGLSQLHQLRGRVGRGRERAYAYFLYPPEKPMTETAHDRLRTIASNTDLGSGMAVAMKDLEIRGAGNLLGGEQSGHIQGVGFDLYVRLIGEAVADFRGDAVDVPAEIKIELPVDAHLPHDYVPGERLRLEAYKKLATVETFEAVDEIEAELRDRYGAPPKPVQNLLEVARLRVVARAARIGDIGVQGKVVRFGPVKELRESQQLRLMRLYPGTLVKEALGIILVPFPMTARVGGKPLRDVEVLTWARQFITALLLPDIGADRT